MKTMTPRSHSRIATFMSILLAIVLVAGCAQKVVIVDGPKINLMVEADASSSKFDAVPFLWNIGKNTLKSSGTAAVHVEDIPNGGILCWQPGSPVRVVQQWSYLSKKPLITTISSWDVNLLTPPEGMQHLLTQDGFIDRWYVSDESAFVSVPLELDALPNKTLDGKTLAITEQGVASGSKAQTLTVPVPSGQTQMVVEYGSGSITNGFVLVEASEKVVKNASGSIWLLRMNSTKGTWVRCDDAFGGIITSDQGSSFARVGSLLYFTHTDMKIGCIDTSATSLSVTLPETINTLLAKLHREQPIDAPYNVQAQLASDNGTLIIEYPDANWNALYYAVDASGTVLGSLRSDKTSITSFDAKGKQGSSINTPGSISFPSIGLFQ
ncbi:hypothetical protein [Candidatus Cryosericum odellii]|jgi:hypothetical protein|uniref:hypothetical protein n=1 Tax=Candidatus Cryosericum odellii TaxID=2290917 RepID=UPI000F86B014|nr:hypothetical protein [Candidatus Cryosericum odellii]